MTLEEFERSLAQERNYDEESKSHRRQKENRSHHKHHSRQKRDSERHHHSKRRRLEDCRYSGEHDGHRRRPTSPVEEVEGDLYKVHDVPRGLGARSPSLEKNNAQVLSPDGQISRDAWMQEPSSLDIDFTQKGVRKPAEPTRAQSSKVDFELKIHHNELNKHHLENLAEGKEIPEAISEETPQHAVDYSFGDAGAQWRMTKLKSVYRRAEETGNPVDKIAEEQYGDLRAFDDAREEQIELDRRETYGEGYVGKERPNGDLFEERKLDMGIRRKRTSSTELEHDEKSIPRIVETKEPIAKTAPLDQTALNRLKAQMLKAKVRGSSDASTVEAEYNSAIATFTNRKEADVVVLGAMHNTMLAGPRGGEVTNVDSRRGRERGLVKENEDMTIEDMVKQERRSRHQAGGDGRRFAERIAKDAKFDNDLDYMDENAAKLAKRVEKSEINLKNAAISDFQKMSRVLDNCPLCHHEDTANPPVAPVVSLATRVYLTLPTEPEISDGGACIVPVQHRGNLLECDDDEWEEVRNFMKSLTRMYHDQGRDVIFYENAAMPHKKKHAGMEVVPLPYSLGETASAFFKEAILTSDEEWTQHKKIIDTLSKAKNGLGKSAFRRTLVKEMPYFHVWFEIDGGLGHIVEDANRWPKGDLFAREIIGGMLDREPNVIKKQGRWSKGEDRRVEGFRKRWRKFDWTRVLTDS